MGFTPRSQQNIQYQQELLTLQEVYQIEFGTRAMWKMTFDNGPEQYRKSILAIDCNETTRQVQHKRLPAGNWYLYVPQVQHQASISCTLLDDRMGTIERWARNWWASTNKDQVYHNLQYPTKYVSTCYVYHYNMQYDLIFARKYIVLPSGGINTGFNQSVSASTVKLNFDCFGSEPL